MNILQHEIKKEKARFFFFFNRKDNIKEDKNGIIANTFFRDQNVALIRFGHQDIALFESHYSYMRIDQNAKKQCDKLIKILLNSFRITVDQIPTMNGNIIFKSRTY